MGLPMSTRSADGDSLRDLTWQGSQYISTHLQFGIHTSLKSYTFDRDTELAECHLAGTNAGLRTLRSL